MTETRIAEGDILTTFEQFEAAPLGTVTVRDGNGANALTRVLTGWIDDTSNVQTSGRLTQRGSGRTVTKVGVEVEETFDQYVQRFITYTLGSAVAHNVTRRPVREAHQALNIQRRPFVVGSPVHPRDEDAQPPTGTLAVTGAPNFWRHYGVFCRDHNGLWQYVTGGLTAAYDTLTIISMSGLTERTEEWVTAVPNEEDRLRILRFKREAWAIGNAAKQVNGWCPAYESTMDFMGINARVGVVPPPVADPITMDQAVELPVGSLIRFTNPETSTDYWVARHVSEGNYERIVGDRPMHDTEGIEVLTRDGHAVSLAITCAADLDNLPVGSQISHGGQTYQKSANNGLWGRVEGYAQEVSGAYDAAAFNPGSRAQDTITRIGTAPVANDTARATLGVGQAVGSMANMRSMPSGTVFRNINTGTTFTRNSAGDGFTRNSDGNGFPEDYVFGSLRRLVVDSIPEGSVTEPAFTVGQRLRTNAEVNSVPVGTVVSKGDSRTWTRVTRTQWRCDGEESGRLIDVGRRAFSDDTCRFDTVVIESLPETGPRVGDSVMTVEQQDALPVGTRIRQRSDGRLFERQAEPHRDYWGEGVGWMVVEGIGAGSSTYPSRGFSYNHDTEGALVIESLPPVEADATEVQAVTSEFSVGQVITDYDVADRLPVDTVCTTIDGNVTRRVDGRWVREGRDTGPRTSDLNMTIPQGYFRIVSLPTGGQGPRVGDVVQHEAVADMPVGSLVRWDDGGSPSFYLRHATIGNPMGTINMAHGASGWASDVDMTVLHDGVGPVHIPVGADPNSLHLLQVLPVGSQITVEHSLDGDGNVFTLMPNRHWSRGRGDVTHDRMAGSDAVVDFGTRHVTRIGS